MIPLAHLIARFKNLSNTERFKKELVCEEIKTIINIPITHNQISFSKNSVFIKTQPIMKSEIVLHKDAIIEKIRTISGLSNISDIQ